MKEAFRSERITPAKGVYIETVNEILEEYAAQGYKLTLRQLYYQLVARDHIPNLVQEYSKLSRILVFGRMNGLVDWDHIEDRLRKPWLPYWVTDPADAIQDVIGNYRLNRQADQETYIELWTEKDAISNILRKLSNHYHIRLVVNRGYTSCSAMKAAFERFKYHSGNPLILYVGDHDPSGLDMIRDINDRLDEFGLWHFHIDHVALTMAQIEEYDPPPNPAKITDPRAKWYMKEFGSESWELDALRPEVLSMIVDLAILKNVDINKFMKILKKEDRDKKGLEKIMRKWK